MKIDVTQQPVAPESAVAIENFAARSDQIADSPGQVSNFEWASGETSEKKELTGRIETCSEGWTEYIEITQWQCVIEYASGGECVCRARIRNHREAVVSWNGAHLERRLSYYS